MKWELTTDSENRLARFETLVEIHQHKGSSECLNSSATGVDGQDGWDQWCEFELATTTTGETNELEADGTGFKCYDDPTLSNGANRTGLPCRQTDAAGYVRAGLGQGLVQYTQTPADGGPRYNHVKLGISASTDSHNATPGYTLEENWQGHTGGTEDDSTERTASTTASGAPATTRYNNPGGLTAVWSKHKKREDIFDALSAREVYATSGTRPTVWFFQVWDQVDYCAKDANGNFTFNAATVRANGGVPMGGTMTVRNNGSQPRFVVFAMKDQYYTNTSGMSSHNLYEINLIQTRAVSSGSQTISQDAIFRVRAQSANGDAIMCAQFRTDDLATDGTSRLVYDPTIPSLWYARVIEKPSYSWRYYDCRLLEGTSSACSTDITGTNNDYNTPLARVHERAWTSPIWFMP